MASDELDTKRIRGTWKGWGDLDNSPTLTPYKKPGLLIVIVAVFTETL